MMNKEGKWLIGIGVVAFVAVLFLGIRNSQPRELTVREEVENMLLRSSEVPLNRKAEIIQSRAKSAYERLMSPELLQEKAAMAEAKRLANWKANFPWKPTHDPALKFDPERHLSASTIEEWRSRKRSATDHFAADYHNTLARFFQDEMRFTPQFEECYRILNEHGRGHNPVLAWGIFWDLWWYHEIANDWRSKLPGSRAIENSRNSIRGRLLDYEWLNPHFLTDAGKAEAAGIVDRLINEVKGMENLSEPMGCGSGGSVNENVTALMHGEAEMLVPHVGWYEGRKILEAEERRQFKISYEEGDPSLKEAAPELFPPVDVKNGRLVDKDGDPVKYHEGMHVGIINAQGETMPMMVDEDGGIRFPTPAEIETLREQGEIQPAPPEMIDRLPTPSPMPQQAVPPAQAEPAPGPLTSEEQMVIDAIEEVLAE